MLNRLREFYAAALDAILYNRELLVLFLALFLLRLALRVLLRV